MGCAASKERPSSRKSRSKNQSPKSPADSKRKQLAESSTSDPRRQQKKKLVTPGGSAASNPLTTSFNTTEIFNTSGQKIPHGSPKRPPSAGKESPQSAIRDVPETTEQWVPLHPQAELSTFANATQGLPPAEPSIMAVPSIELTEAKGLHHTPSTCTSEVLKLAAQLVADDDDGRRESALSRVSNMYAPQLGMDLPTLGRNASCSSGGSAASLAAFRH